MLIKLVGGEWEASEFLALTREMGGPRKEKIPLRQESGRPEHIEQAALRTFDLAQHIIATARLSGTNS